MSTTDVGFIDRGGIQYRIDVEGNGQERLDAFRASLTRTRRSFRAFRQDIRGLNSEARGVARGLDALTKSSAALSEQRVKSAQSARDQTRASRALGRQAAQQARQTQQQVQAERRLSKAQRERARLQAQLQRLTRTGPQAREIRQLREKLALTRQIIRAEQRLRAAQSLNDQGRDIQTGELFAEQQKRLLIEAQNKLKREQATLNNTALRQTNAELAATQRILRAEQQLANEQALRAQGRLQTGLTPEQTAFRDLQRQLDGLRLEETQRRLQRTSGEFRRLNREANQLRRRLGLAQGGLLSFNNRLRRTESQANRISFTFRRLIGIFAAFQALRLGADFFTGAIRGGIQFNALIERAQLGVASLFTAVGEVRDPFGQVVNSSEQLAQAQREARRQTQLLRRDSLETLATFEQLLDTFQVAVAPGFAAGLDVQAIRRFTVSISQAAAAIGVPQEQLAEEIRSLLSGTIQARTTRIATALGITNEDVRRARELGVLSEFLQERFEAFGVAGSEALNTFDGLIARVRDGLSQLAGAGGLEFFEEIKGLLRDIIDFVQIENELGFLEPSPQALAVIEALLSGLTEAVQVARDLRDSLELSDVLAVAQGLGDAIGIAAQLVSVVLAGVLAGVADLSNLFNNLGDSLEGVADFFGSSSVSSFLTTLIRVATVLIGIQVTLGLVGGLFSTLLLPVRLLLGPLTAISGLLTKMGITLSTQILAPLRLIRRGFLAIFSPLGLALVAVVAIGAAIKNWLDDLLGVELKLSSFVRILGTSLVGSFQVAIATIQLGFVRLFGLLRLGFRNVVQGVQELALGFLDLVLEAAAIFSDTAEEFQRDLSRFRDQDRAEFKAQLEQDAQDIKNAEQALIDARRAIAEQTGENINKIIEENADAASVLEALGIQDIIDGIGGLFDGVDFDNPFDDANNSADSLIERLDALPAVIGRGEREVDGLAQALKRLDDQIRQAQGQLQLSIGGAGLDGAILNTRRELLQAEVDLREQSRQIEEERRSILQAEVGLQSQLNRELSQQDALGIADLAQQGVVLAKQRNDILRETGILEDQIGATLRAQRDAQSQGDEDRVASLQEQLELLREQERQAKQALADQNEAIEQFSEAAGGAEEQQALNDAIVARITLEAQSLSNNERLQSLLEQQLLLEQSRNELAATRIQTLTQGDLQGLRDRFDLLQAEVAAEQVLADTRNRFGNRTAAAELAQAQARLAVEQTRFNLQAEAFQRSQEAAEANTAELNRQVALAQTRLDQVNELAANQLASAQDVEAAQQAVNAAEQARDDVLAAQTLELQLQTLELEKQGIAIDVLRQKAEEFQQDQIDSPIAGGLEAGLDDFITQAEDVFGNFRELASSALQDISGALADEILNAIDPNSNADFGERLAAVLQSIARTILQNAIAQGIAGIFDSLRETPANAQKQQQLAQETLLLQQRQAIVAQETLNATTLAPAYTAFGTGSTALAGVSPALVGAGTQFNAAGTTFTAVSPQLVTAGAELFAAAVQLEIAASILLAANIIGAGAGVGAQTGGHITRGGAPSVHHFSPSVQSLAGGGRVHGFQHTPPPGVDRRDRVPIWAQRHEFMQPVNAVRLYGVQTMEAIRRMRVDPNALRALAGVGRSSILRVAQPRLGFQTGGEVTQGTTASSFQELEQDDFSSGETPLGFIVGEDEADTIFAQGENALLELMSQQKTKFRSALGL